MTKTKGACLAALAAAAALSGCMGGMLSSWPTRATPDAGGVLFKLDCSQDIGAMTWANLQIFFYRSGEKTSSTKFWMDMGKCNQPPNDLVLLNIPPGAYANISPRVILNPGPNYKLMFVSLDDPKNSSMNNFKVEPGKVTVLGALTVNFKALDQGDKVSWKGSTVEADDRASTKRSILKSAVDDERAVGRKWKEPLLVSWKEYEEM